MQPGYVLEYSCAFLFWASSYQRYNKLHKYPAARRPSPHTCAKWAGASLMLRSGTIFLVATFTISLIRYIPSPSGFHAGILLRSGILIVASIILFLVG